MESARRCFHFYPESIARCLTIRFPDLMIKTKRGIIAIEIERSRKTGKKKIPMIENIVKTNQGGGMARHSFDGISPDLIAFAFNKTEIEVENTGKKKKLNHCKSVKNSIYNQMKISNVNIIDICWFELTIKNFGVIKIDYKSDPIDSTL